MIEDKERWAWSHDGERYHGETSTWQEAAAEAFADSGSNDRVWVGRAVEPTKAEEYIDASLLIEHVQCQDGYSSEWGEDWPGSTKEQDAELTEAVQRVFGEWLDRHDLRPTFFDIEDSRTVTREEAGVLSPEAVTESPGSPS